MTEFLNGENMFQKYPTLDDLRAAKANCSHGVPPEFSRELRQLHDILEVLYTERMEGVHNVRSVDKTWRTFHAVWCYAKSGNPKVFEMCGTQPSTRVVPPCMIQGILQVNRDQQMEATLNALKDSIPDTDLEDEDLPLEDSTTDEDHEGSQM